MFVSSTRFGTFEADDSTILHFKGGIPGFEGLEDYLLVFCEQTVPINWLQSLQDPDLSLPVLDPFLVMPDYKVDVDDSMLFELEIEDVKKLLVYCVCVIPNSLKKCTINLAAPIIINTSNNYAKQIALESPIENALRYPAYEALRAQVSAACE